MRNTTTSAALNAVASSMVAKSVHAAAVWFRLKVNLLFAAFFGNNTCFGAEHTAGRANNSHMSSTVKSGAKSATAAENPGAVDHEVNHEVDGAAPRPLRL